MITIRYQQKIIVIATLLLIMLGGGIYYAYNFAKQQIDILEKPPSWVFNTNERILACAPNNNSEILVYTTNSVSLVDTTTGNQKWTTRLNKDTYSHEKYIVRVGIKTNGDVAIISRGDGEVISIETDNGKLLWRDTSPVGAPVFDMDINKDFAYITRLSSSIVGIEHSTGSRIWINSVPDRTSLYVFSINDKVYLGTGYELFVYDAQTGNLLLEQKLEGLMGKMFVDFDHVYIIYRNGKSSLVFLDAESLNQEWSIPRVQLPLSEADTIFVEEDVIYIGGSRLVSLSASSGDVLWISEVVDSFGPPLVHGNLLFVQGKTRLYIFNKIDGRVISSQKLPTPFPLFSWISYSQANPCGTDTMFLLVSKNKLYAYNLSQ